ncbi:MAG: tRNA-dihydrouridine synthase [Verrucomicrobiales bacterium]
MGRRSDQRSGSLRLLENCGVQAVAVHGRTRSQGYGGRSRLGG